MAPGLENWQQGSSPSGPRLLLQQNHGLWPEGRQAADPNRVIPKDSDTAGASPTISESHRKECVETVFFPGFPRGWGGSGPDYQISRLNRHPLVKTAQKPEPGGDGGRHWEPWAEPLRNVLRTQKDLTRSPRSYFRWSR